MTCEGGKGEYRMRKEKGQQQKPGEHQYLKNQQKKMSPGSAKENVPTTETKMELRPNSKKHHEKKQ